MKTASQSRVRSRGLTLAEVLVALSIASMLLVVVWSLFGAGIRHYLRSERHNETTLSALLAASALERDLARVLTDVRNAEDPLRVEADGRGLTFDAARSDPSDLMRVHAETVRYALGPPDRRGVRRLLRNDVPVEGVWLKDLAFAFVGPDAPGSEGACAVRAVVRATDGNGRSDFALVRLFCLDLPSRLVAAKRVGR